MLTIHDCWAGARLLRRATHACKSSRPKHVRGQVRVVVVRILWGRVDRLAGRQHRLGRRLPVAGPLVARPPVLEPREVVVPVKSVRPNNENKAGLRHRFPRIDQCCCSAVRGPRGDVGRLRKVHKEGGVEAGLP